MYPYVVHDGGFLKWATEQAVGDPQSILLSSRSIRSIHSPRIPVLHYDCRRSSSPTRPRTERLPAPLRHP